MKRILQVLAILSVFAVIAVANDMRDYQNQLLAQAVGGQDTTQELWDDPDFFVISAMLSERASNLVGAPITCSLDVYRIVGIPTSKNNIEVIDNFFKGLGYVSEPLWVSPTKYLIYIYYIKTNVAASLAVDLDEGSMGLLYCYVE